MRRSLGLIGLALCGLLLGWVAARSHDEDDDEDEDEDEKWKVLVIMVDGCRWDYVMEEGLDGFRELEENGVRAEYVQPVFPSNSYPNWYSIATGLYSESHGFIDNEMYNETTGEIFLMLPHPNASNSHWWDGAVPIWITAEKVQLNTALYWWGGCEVTIQGKRPRICLPHGDWHVTTATVRKAFDEILDAFEEDKIELAQLYYGHVDHYGHNFGPDSAERKHALKEIDKLLLELQENLTDRALDNKVNVIVVSDHGMTSTGPKDVTGVDLNNFSRYVKLALGGGSRYWLLPYPNQEEKLFAELEKAEITGIRIYKKEDIPEKYHVKNNPLTLPILIQAEKGFVLLPLQDSRKHGHEKVSAGNHGYDPFDVEDMRTIFFARGPAFRQGYVSPPLQNVDHYNLLCHLLDITSLPNNGSWERVVDMLSDDDEDDDEHDYSDKDNSAVSCSTHAIVLLFTVTLHLQLLAGS